MAAAKSSEGSATQIKRTRVATVSYPYHPLEACIEFARAVREIGNGRADVTKSQLAHRIGASEKSGDFAQKIASSKTYGLLEGKSALRLTEVASQFFFPTDESPDSKKLCLFRFFGAPGAFKALIERYDGSKPPSTELAGNILGQNYGIPESWKDRVAGFFIRSAQFAGAMGADGFLRYKAQMDGLSPSGAKMPESEQPDSFEKPFPPPASQSDKPANKPDLKGIAVWTFPCGDKFVRIETPENMTKEVWEKVNKYIQVLQP